MRSDEEIQEAALRECAKLLRMLPTRCCFDVGSFLGAGTMEMVAGVITRAFTIGYALGAYDTCRALDPYPRAPERPTDNGGGS